MTRPLRIEVPGGFHHVTSRGNARRTIFLEDFDHTAFLAQLRWCVVRFRWRCIAYCLMGNHYHLILQTPDPNLGDGMRELNGQYAQRFNRRHGLDGSLFKPRYHSQLVQDDAYLLAATRYVMLNPIRAGLVDRPEHWRWSSYAGLVAGADPPMVDPRPVLELMHDRPEVARRRLADMVLDGAGLPPFDPEVAIVGDEAFVALYAPEERPPSGVDRRAWEQARPPLTDLAEALERDELIRCARLDHNYTLREIAETVGCSPETIRRRLRMWDVRTDPFRFGRPRRSARAGARRAPL